ncbi:MAG TPA: hypothetical protein VM784_14050 [Actinomycetota bacterium]|jgi:hypothetical protein|nr:hypothetical protein [Actinomycetota bacterium]
MRRTLTALALAAGSLAVMVPTAHAGVSATVCYSVQVTVNGESAVNEAGCQEAATP